MSFFSWSIRGTFSQQLIFFAQYHSSTNSTSINKQENSTQVSANFTKGLIVSFQLCSKKNYTVKKCHKLSKLLKNAKATSLIEAFSATSLDSPTDSKWYSDTRGTSHMTNEVASLDNYVLYNGFQWVFVGNGNSLPISRIGSPSHPLLLPTHDHYLMFSFFLALLKIFCVSVSLLIRITVEYHFLLLALLCRI